MTTRRIMTALLIGGGLLAYRAEGAERLYDKLKWDVGIRDVYLRGLKQPDVWKAAKTIGVTRLEVVVDENLTCPGLFEGDAKPYRIDTPANRKKLMQALADHGASISCFCAVIRGKDAPSQKHVDWITRVTEAAGEMEVPVIMMPLGYGDKTDEAYVAKSVAFFKKLVPVARRTGVVLTYENLGRYLNRREIALPILEGLPRDCCGIANDITNMYWYGHPIDTIYELAKAVAPYVRYVHVKSIKYPAAKKNTQRKPGWEYGKYAEPVRTGDIDFHRIIAIYAAAGFKGDLTIEDDSLRKFDAAGKTKVLIDDVKLLREVIKEVEASR